MHRAQRTSLTLTGLAVGLALAIAPATAVTPGGTGDSGVYIVQFEEPALADYVGPDARDKSAPRLAATSPIATGERKLDVATAASRAYRGFLSDRRAERLEMASTRLGRELRPTQVYDVVFNGVAVELSPAEAQRLAKLPGVRQVERERVEYLQTDAGPRWIKADQLWSGAAGVQTRGEGVVVGVVDSGIHAGHPSFAAASGDGYTHVNPRGGFLGLCAQAKATCNGKLIGIYDYITESSEQTNGSDVNGHGSHVAGIVAGNPLTVNMSGTLRNVSGAAPRAHLISYKACWNKDGSGTCPGSATLAALNQAVADQVDVINYSIGGTAISPWSSSNASAMRSARNAGIVVVVAAGNDGPGEGTVTSPGNAPWVITAASASHTRVTVNQLFLSGGGTPPPNGGVLVGASATGGTAGAIALVRPDPLLCAEGSNETGTAGENKPAAWNSTTYAGKMVLCDRGIYPRVAKSKNTQLAGAAAMVLLNQASDGASVVADAHSIPATHLRHSDAQALLQWLSSGSGHMGRLDAATLRDDASFADLLASSSGRGPTKPDNLMGVLKPDVTAPGVSVLAADKSGSTLVTKSGTSMAAPHVAGAAALLRAANPGWRANAIISALSTSARPSVKLADGVTIGSPFDQGAGTIDVSLAVRAALSFNVTDAEFVAANPSAGGLPRTLNLPSLVHEACDRSCGLTRRVTDLAGGGTWQVQFDNLPAGMTGSASPAQFTLGAGQSQTIEFTFNAGDPALAGRWVHGSVRLKRVTNDGRPDAVLPTALKVTGAVAANEYPVWYFPEASDDQNLPQGFLRVINNSQQSGHVIVSGIDATGRSSSGIASFTLGPLQAMHFNAQDLEQGNSAKGLAGSLGNGQGAWRMSVSSDLADLTVLTYNRNRVSGFVTSLHDKVPEADSRHEVVFFNPSSNPEQASRLVLINPGSTAAAVALYGIDDAGNPGENTVTLSLPAGASRELRSEDLEQGASGLIGRLGDGAGKWRLWIEATQPIRVLSLVHSPTGDLTNVSTAADNAMAANDYLVWYFPEASDDPKLPQAFLRVINNSQQSGLVTVRGVDAVGQGSGVASFNLGPLQAMQFNAQDLEQGSPSKGLGGSLGNGQGAWRLSVSSDLADLKVLTYNRNRVSGFVTSLHDAVPDAGSHHEVVFFNPSSNPEQASRLVLTNPGSTAAAVTVSGIDDAGHSGESLVLLSLPAGASRELSSEDMEQGASGLSGRLGDGAGKWRLRIEANRSIRVLSLVHSPTGDLTNVSTLP